MTQEIQLEIDRLKKQLQNQNIPASLKEKISLKLKALENTVEKTEEQVQVIEKKEEKLEKEAESDLSDAIDRMEKQLKNPRVPDSLKDKIRAKLEKAKADVKEVKKEQVEEKKIKEEKVAQAKQEVKETLKKVKEVIQKKTSTPKEKTEEVKKAVTKSSEAVQKAKKATEESTKSTKKRTSKLKGALRELQQIINANPTLKALYKGKGVDLKRDAARQAKPIGYRFKGKHNYRIPKNLDNPNVYYEGRPDKGDAYQNKRRGVYFADGGGVKSDYYIFEGVDNLNGNTLYRVESNSDSENEYVGEWHKDKSDAEKELKSFYADGGMMADGGKVSEIKMYYHETSGGAEYLCSEKVRGTNEGNMKSKYVVRLDGAKRGSEMSVNNTDGDDLKTLKMYYHKTSGGAEYLCSSKVEGTNEGDLKSEYVVRLDGAKKGSEMTIKKKYADGGMMADGEEIRGGIRYAKGKELEWYDIIGFDIADYGEKEAERKAYDYIQDSIKYWNGELNEEDFKVRRIGGGKDYKGRAFDSWVVMRQFPKYADGGMMARGGRSLMSMANLVVKDDLKKTKLKNWYTKNYPTDDLGEAINPNVSFKDLWDCLHNNQDVYKLIGVGDSVIRERLFDQLSEMTGHSDDNYVTNLYYNYQNLPESEWSEYPKETMVGVAEEYVNPKYIKTKKSADGGMMARGGKTKSRYNEGLSWHQDHARFNKSQSYERPLKRRRKY